MNCSCCSYFSLSVNCSHGSLFVQCELFTRFAVRTVRSVWTVRTVRCSSSVNCCHGSLFAHIELFALFARFRFVCSQFGGTWRTGYLSRYREFWFNERSTTWRVRPSISWTYLRMFSNRKRPFLLQWRASIIQCNQLCYKIKPMSFGLPFWYLRFICSWNTRSLILFWDVWTVNFNIFDLTFMKYILQLSVKFQMITSKLLHRCNSAMQPMP